MQSEIEYNLGVRAAEAGNTEEAFQHYEASIQLDPKNVQGNVHKAIEYYKEAINCDAGFKIGYKNISVAYNDLGSYCFSENGDVDGAIRYFKKALKYNIGLTDAYYNLGVVYSSKGTREEAIKYYKYCVSYNPDYINAHNNLGAVHKELNQFTEAEACYLAALRINPNFPAGRVSEATSHLEIAIKNNPNYGTAFNMMGSIKRDIMKSAEAIEFFKKAAELEPNERGPMDNMLLVMNDIYGLSNESIYEAHLNWGINFSKQYPQFPPPTNRDKNKNRTLKVGYVSADMSTHSVSYFSEVFFSHSPSTEVQNFLYSNSPVIDHTTQRLMNYPNLTWKQIEDAATLIREDEIDILVDLAGHTGGNRLDVFAHKPAPIQITCVGYPNTTGLPQIDYRVTDEYVDPESSTQQFSEKLIRVQGGSFLCYTPALFPEILPTPPVSRNSFVTFGSFNNAAKMNEQVFDLWTKVLLAVPNSRLILKCKTFASDEMKEDLLERLSDKGLDRSRISLLSHKGEVVDHLMVYNSIDIALDTFPYAGTTTTVESMYMGVPVVTLRGNNHAHNVGISLLTSVGPLVSDLIANDEDEFVSIAVKLANDEKRIANIHSNLRETLLSSRLCNREDYIGHIMKIYRDAWCSWCDST